MIKIYWCVFVSFLCNADKKPKPENIEIYTIKIYESRTKVIKITLEEIWKKGCIIRINNFGDKENSAHSEKDIKNQVRNVDDYILSFIETKMIYSCLNRVIKKLLSSLKCDKKCVTCLVLMTNKQLRSIC